MENNHLIDWRYISANFGELRRHNGQTTVAARTSTSRPPAKRRRIDSDNHDVTLCPEKFPTIDETDNNLVDPARFLVDAVHTKIFVAAVYSLMKFGDSVQLIPTRNGLTLKACNITRTAAGTYNFCLEFFGAINTFDFPKDKPCCRVFMKPFLIILKKTESLKQLENLILDLDPNAEAMIFRVTLRNGVRKIYKIPLTDVLANSMPRLIQRDNSLNFIILMARQLWDALEIVGKDAHEIGFWGSVHDIIFHTLFQIPHSNARWRKAATRITDCTNSDIRKLVSFSFNVRDVRALCRFADKYNSSVVLYFKTAKHPLFAVVDIPGLCEATFTVSTSVVYGVDTGKTIVQMIPGIDLTIPAATQTREDNSLTTSLNESSRPSQHFEPVEVSQSHPLVRSSINTMSESYWKRAVAVRELETIDIA